MKWHMILGLIGVGLLAEMAGAAADAPGLKGVWNQTQTGNVVRKGGPFEHFANKGKEPAFGDPGSFQLTIEHQEGAAFSGTWASKARTDPIVGVVSGDGQSVFMADDNGPLQGRLIGTDEMEVCRALVDSNRMLAACRMLRRR